MVIKSHRDLIVWQKSMDLAIEVYRLAKRLPPDERFNLVSQMCRCAVSVPCNIAEGHGRIHRADYLHYLAIARGSLAELSTQLEVAFRVSYLEKDASSAAEGLVDEVGRLLNALIRAVGESVKTPSAGRIFELTELYDPYTVADLTEGTEEDSLS